MIELTEKYSFSLKTQVGSPVTKFTQISLSRLKHGFPQEGFI
jgi:hypothetical protein